MRDINRRRLLGRLFEVAMASNKGFKIFKYRIPVLDITKKVCKELKIDHLIRISFGNMLITSKNGEELIRQLNGK